MCTIVVLHRAHPRAPLIVAANRDEVLDRPSTPPQVIRASEPRVVAGIDRSKGGTWMGLNDQGLFVGLTNQAAGLAPDPALRSRGEVVRSLLEAPTLAAARARVDALDPAAYNPFNLFVGDGRDLDVVYARRAPPSLRRTTLAPGLHVLPNDELGSPRFPKAARARALLDPVELGALPLEEVAERMQRALADHAEPPSSDGLAGATRFAPEVAKRMQALCIHMPYYGTCSATFVAARPGEPLMYRFADGKPCQAPFEDVMPLLRA